MEPSSSLSLNLFRTILILAFGLMMFVVLYSRWSNDNHLTLHDSSGTASQGRFVNDLQNKQLVIVPEEQQHKDLALHHHVEVTGNQEAAIQDERRHRVVREAPTLQEKLRLANLAWTQADMEKLMGAKIVVENNVISGKKFLCAYSNVSKDQFFCYPQVFEPEHHRLKPVYWGQVLPPGLHIKMDLEKGTREARWPEEAHERQTPAEMGGHHSNRPVHTWSALDHALSNLLHQYLDYPNDGKKIVSLLAPLEELVHDVNLGLDVASNMMIQLPDNHNAHWRSMDLLTSLLGHQDVVVREKTALVIGYMAENNAEVQKVLFSHTERRVKDQLFYRLLLMILNEKQIESELLFAFANLCRGSNDAHQLLFSELPVDLTADIHAPLHGKTPLDALIYASEQTYNSKFNLRFAQFILDMFTTIHYRDESADQHVHFWWNTQTVSTTRNICNRMQALALMNANFSEHSLDTIGDSIEAIGFIFEISKHDEQHLCDFNRSFIDWAKRHAPLFSHFENLYAELNKL